MALFMFHAGTSTWQGTRRGPILLTVGGLLLVGALIQSFFIPLDADVSWLITVCERLLSGARLYHDIVEVNPPASVWLYLPWVALAQLIGARPEPVVAAALFAGALLSIHATLRLTARLTGPPSPLVVAAVCGFVTMVLPGGLFAQREHVALLLALPTLAALALLGDRKRLPRRTAVLAGLGAGLIICIKPHFALALLAPMVPLLRKLPSPLPLLLPAAAASGVLLLYALATLLLAPGFLQLLPMLAATYLPMHAPWSHFLLSSLLIVPAALAAAMVLLRAQPDNGLAQAWLLGGIGFALAGLLQGKAYANHALPGYSLALAAVLLVLMGRSADPGRRRLVGVGVGALTAALLLQTFTILPQPGLAEAIRRVAPPRPTLITLGSELTTGHPAVRHVDGHWAGSRAGLFTASGALFVGLDRPGVRGWYEQDLALFAADVRRSRPDIVLVERGAKWWLLREPVIRSVMHDYRPAARAGEIEVWRRR